MRPAPECNPDLIVENSPPLLKAVVLYENITAGIKAKHVTDLIIGKLEPDCAFDTTLWNVRLVEIGSLSALVAEEAAEAEIAIISLRDGNGLSLSLRMWINQWLIQRKGTHSALIVLFENTGSATDFARRHLGNAAYRAGIDFFTQTGNEADEESHPSPSVSDHEQLPMDVSSLLLAV